MIASLSSAAAVARLGLCAALAAALLVAPAEAQVGPPVKLAPLADSETPAGEQPAGALDAATAQQGAPSDATQEGRVEVERLAAIDPSSVGLLDQSNGGFGLEMWRGTRRSLVERLLPRLPMGMLSPPMQDLARRLLLSTARVPDGEQGGQSLLGLRIERLAAGGETVAVNDLLRLTPARLTDRAFARARLDGLLLAGNHAGACAEFKSLVADDPDETYWLKGLTFCKALNGERAAARFAVDLLQELGERGDAAFFALVESLNGATEAQVASLLDPDALHLAMLQVAQLPVPDDALPGAPPSILRAIAKAPNASLELRLAAAEQAEAAGALSAAELAEIYKSVIFEPEQIASSQTIAEREPGPRANALLYQAGQLRSDPAERARALQLAWRLARQHGGFGTQARVNREVALSLGPDESLIWFAEDAVRALIAADEIAAALEWFNLAQAAASRSDTAAGAVLHLWPLIYVAAPSYADAWDPKLASLWWKGLESLDVPDEERQRKVALVFTLLHALGYEVPAAEWERLFAAPLTVTAYVPSPPLRHALLAAVKGGRVAETVLLSLLVLGDGGPAGADANVLSDVVSALRAVDLGVEARAIALEAALAKGV